MKINTSSASCSKLAVLITCFNRKAKTKKCLEILFSQSLPDSLELQVFVCDDGSKDGTGEMLATDFPNVTVVQGNSSLFWNGGTNLAWIKAKDSQNFDFFLWLSDDTYLKPYALLDLFKQYETLQNPAIITGACLEPQKRKFSFGGITNKGPAIPNGLL